MATNAEVGRRVFEVSARMRAKREGAEEMASHKSNCAVNADRACGLCTCGAEEAENEAAYTSELEKVASAARAAVAFKVDWTSREAADRWEELNNAVKALDRKFV